MTAVTGQQGLDRGDEDRGATRRDWDQRLARRTHALGGSEITAILSLAGATDVITFSGGFPEPATFQTGTLADIAARLIADEPGVALQYSATEGLAGVRDYVSGRLAAADGRAPGAGELMITSGGIDCMELLAKSYIDPGDVVVVEAPTYLGGLMAFRGYEADVRGVPVDDAGMRVDVLNDLLAGGLRPKIVYTIPDYQNPTGLSMSAERRQELVDLARRYDFLILEDVAYRELGFGPALRTAAPPRRRACGRWRPMSCCRRARSPRSSRPDSGWAGPPGRPRSSAGSSSPSRTPTSARARSASGCSRSTAGAVTWTVRSPSPGCCTGGGRA